MYLWVASLKKKLCRLVLRPFRMHVGEDSSWKCWDGGKKQNRRRSDGWRRSLLISQLCLHPPGIFIYSAALCSLSSFHCSPVEEDLTAAVYTSQDAPATVVSFKFKDNSHIKLYVPGVWWDFKTSIFVCHCLIHQAPPSPPPPWDLSRWSSLKAVQAWFPAQITLQRQWPKDPISTSPICSEAEWSGPSRFVSNMFDIQDWTSLTVPWLKWEKAETVREREQQWQQVSH